MSLKVRRVVTGHDPNGRAIAMIDEIAHNMVSRRPGHASCVIWTTDSSPADNSGRGDEGLRPVGTTLANGTVFRIIAFAPGVAPRMHRTSSIDYAIVMSGEIDMQLDDSEVHLKAGDVLVQRGTIHNWVNRGTEPCVMGFVLVDAKPAVAGGRALDPTG
jgi:quercetin dioxygenase-like cupin family protein